MVLFTEELHSSEVHIKIFIERVIYMEFASKESAGQDRILVELPQERLWVTSYRWVSGTRGSMIFFLL